VRQEVLNLACKWLSYDISNDVIVLKAAFMAYHLHEQMVSIIVVNYNGVINLGDRLFKYLESILNTNYPNFECLFVDNRSKDGSADIVGERFEKNQHLKIIRMNKNFGYGEGVNRGLEYCSTNSRYIAILNNDMECEPNWLKELVSAVEANESIGMAASKQLSTCALNKRKTLSMGAHRDVLGFSYAEKGNKRVNIFFAGAGILLRRKVFEDIGGFDETFFILHEDVDLCWRVWLYGYRIVGVPSSIIHHEAYATTSKLPPWLYSFFSARNRLMANIKNYQLKNLFVYSGILSFLYFAYALYVCYKGNALVGKAHIRALLWVLTHLRDIWRRRVEVQSARKRSDIELKRLKIIVHPRLASKLWGHGAV